MSESKLSRWIAPLTIVSLVGALVTLGAWAVAGSIGLQVAAVAWGVTVLIALVTEGLLLVATIADPVQRMFASMFVRGVGAAVAILAGLAAGCEPKALALIALPMYLSLVAAEVIDALRKLQQLQTTTPQATPHAGA